jgi:mono/diheme cytochrome c family protein
MSIARLQISLATVVAALLWGGFADAQQLEPKNPGFAFVTKYCLACHSADEPEGKLDLSRFSDTSAMLSARGVWAKVVRNVRNGEMPPRDADQPTQVERDAFVSAVQQVFRQADANRPVDPGRVVVRRLNRTEYNNTIRDLCMIEFEPAENFPADDASHGFDNNADALALSPLLLERYLDAAEAVIARTLAVPNKKELPTRVGFAQFVTKNTIVPYRVLVFTSEPLTAAFRPAGDGAYLVRVEGKPVKKDDPAPEVALLLDGKEVKRVTFAWPEKSAYTKFEIPVTLKKGKHTVSVSFLNPSPEVEAKRSMFPPRVDGQNKENLRGLELHSIDLVGPTDDEPESRRRILTCDPKAEPPEQAREILARFAGRAFRRPATADEVDRYLKLYDRSRAAGQNFETAVGTSLQAILVSPSFLFRAELDDRPQEKGPHPVSEYHLASRLSYFLWSSMPDEELLMLSGKGELSKQLDAQVKRMLADSKADAFVENFAPQWLEIANIDRVTRGPQFDVRLRASMARETLLFFEQVLRENRPVTDFLDGRYTFVNDRLARLYGLGPYARGKASEAKIPEHTFVRIDLSADGPRAGVLTHASVLTMTSAPDRTSPVKRGIWVLENVLGSPPPPPPADVPSLDTAADPKAPATTLRARLELHRSKPGCAACHAKIDPLGFALEKFDVLGQYRDKDGKNNIDDVGELPDGTKFQGPAGLRTILLARKDRFTRCLTEKVLTYALGRGLGDHDGPTVDAIVAAVAKDDYRFQTLILEVAKSAPFRMRRGTKGEKP